MLLKFGFERVSVYRVDRCAFRARQSGQPSYLYSQLQEYCPTRGSRSNSVPLLQQPHVSTSLDANTRSAETFLTFISRQKTELFQKSYDTWTLGTIAAPWLARDIQVGRDISFYYITFILIAVFTTRIGYSDRCVIVRIAADHCSTACSYFSPRTIFTTWTTYCVYNE